MHVFILTAMTLMKCGDCSTVLARHRNWFLTYSHSNQGCYVCVVSNEHYEKMTLHGSILKILLCEQAHHCQPEYIEYTALTTATRQLTIREILTIPDSWL